jgi:hypothetical protein
LQLKIPDGAQDLDAGWMLCLVSLSFSKSLICRGCLAHQNDGFQLAPRGGTSHASRKLQILVKEQEFVKCRLEKGDCGRKVAFADGYDSLNYFENIKMSFFSSRDVMPWKKADIYDRL